MQILKKCIIILFAFVLAIPIILKVYYSSGIGTKYASKYAEVFGSYNIDEVDRYLDDETLITYRGITKPYKELRPNIISAFKEKEYQMLEGDSYGGLSSGESLRVGIQTYVTSKNYNSEYVAMHLERIDLKTYRVKSLEGLCYTYLDKSRSTMIV